MIMLLKPRRMGDWKAYGEYPRMPFVDRCPDQLADRSQIKLLYFAQIWVCHDKFSIWKRCNLPWAIPAWRAWNWSSVWRCRAHPAEVARGVVAGVDLGGHFTDEKTPTKIFPIGYMEKLLENGVPVTDARTARKISSKTLANARVDMAPDMMELVRVSSTI